MIEYLKQPLDRAGLERVLDLLPDPPAELVRRDKNFKEPGLDEARYVTREAVIQLLLEHLILTQHPVVIGGNRAIVARPSEKVLELLD